MSKVLHPNSYQALLRDLNDPYHSFPEHFSKPIPLSQHVNKYLGTYSNTGNLRSHLEEQGVAYWDYRDKKCRYHRRETNQGWSFLERVFAKSLGSSYSEIKQIILDKKLKYFQKDSAFYYLNKVLKNQDEDYFFNSKGKLERKEKILTTKHEFNPYLYRKFVFEDYSSRDIMNLPMLERFEKFIQMLEYNGYEVEINELSCSFKGKGIQGYVSVDDSITYYYGLVFAEYYEYFNKVSRCSLVFDIPKSKLGFDSALRELTYLGSKSAKKELYEETYEPKHVNPVKWWSR